MTKSEVKLFGKKVRKFVKNIYGSVKIEVKSVLRDIKHIISNWGACVCTCTDPNCEYCSNGNCIECSDCECYCKTKEK